MELKNHPEILFCGSLKNAETSSWDKTNKFLFNAIKKHSNCKHFDYSITNKLFRKGYSVLAKLLYGSTIIRDPLYDLILEFNFKKQFKKLTINPNLILHSSFLCVPSKLKSTAKHILYTDATIMGAIKYNGFSPSEKALNLFTKETIKYINRLHYVFTFNEWTRKSLIEDFQIEERKVMNVGFGANLNPFYGEKDYSNNHLLIVLRRGLEKNKGLLLLLEAFKIAKKENPAIQLSVVGTTLEPIEGVTYYEGFPREKTIELFQQASLYAMPALFEPNGMVYIEALACKTPILGLNRLAFPEFSGYGKFGYIVEENAWDIAKTILAALNNPEALKKMGEEGQNFVLARYDWNIVVNKIINTSLN